MLTASAAAATSTTARKKTMQDDQRIMREMAKHQLAHFSQLRKLGQPTVYEAFVAGVVAGTNTKEDFVDVQSDWINGSHPDFMINPARQRQELADQASACRSCSLGACRTKPVFGHGSVRAKVMLIGEAPGQREDEKGIPFIGDAGRAFFVKSKLNGEGDGGLLAVSGLKREDCYIANTLICWPGPGNPDPQPDQLDACRHFLEKQIALVRPLVLVGVGRFAAQWLLSGPQNVNGTAFRGAKMRDMRNLNFGTDLPNWLGVPILSTYHPAAYLRQPDTYGPMILKDMEMLKQLTEKQ
jgi:uracil-DNA glycosylase